MPSNKNHQSDNQKHSRNRDGLDNPELNSAVSARGIDPKFLENMAQSKEFIAWARFCPDLFLDLLTPEKGGIRLDLDQRVFLRCLVRFISTYGVMPRGYG